MTETVWDVVTITEYTVLKGATTTHTSSPATPLTSPKTTTPSTSTVVPTTTLAVVPSSTQSPGNVLPPAPSITVPTTTQATVPSTASSGQHSGDGTFYELGLTACGQTYSDSDYVAAISYKLFDVGGTPNPNSESPCDRPCASDLTQQTIRTVDRRFGSSEATSMWT